MKITLIEREICLTAHLSMNKNEIEPETAVKRAVCLIPDPSRCVKVVSDGEVRFVVGGRGAPE